MFKFLASVFKTEKTPNQIEERLIKKCNKLYSDFLFSSTKAHTYAYFQFKKELRVDLIDLKNALEKEFNQSRRIEILKNMEEKLVFINNNPFSIDQNITAFKERHLPLWRKTEIFLNAI